VGDQRVHLHLRLSTPGLRQLRRKSILIRLLVLAASSAFCGVATNALVLNMARAAQGVGGAFLFDGLARNPVERLYWRSHAFAFWGASLLSPSARSSAA
jgi:MFS family permease